ncbi:MAG TPA: hemerythrin domain-containing protein [Usitatibacter sp.]|nr:hemerythrin domain-containing protein [Usitatibacter sp.]
MGSPEPARKALRPLLNPPAGFDDPLEMLFGCHRRIEKQLETLKRLRAHLQSKGIDAEASTAAEAVLRYFRKAVVDHHEDEEQDVFPLLEERIDDAGEKARFRELRARLEGEHRKLEEAWARVRKPLEGIAEGLMRTLAEADVNALAEAYQGHIGIEEQTLRELFRFLDARDMEALGRSMAARRSVPYPPVKGA